jgi:ABC-2 type transport system permease protein
MQMNHILSVARWEFVEKVKTKAFIVSLLITPLMMIGFGVLPSWLAKRNNDGTKKFVIYDGTGTIAAAFQKAAAQIKNEDGVQLYDFEIHSSSSENTVLQSIKPRILDEQITGLVLIPGDLEKSRKINYYSQNVGNERDISRFEALIQNILTGHLLLKYKVDPKIYASVSAPVNTESIKLTKDGEATKTDFLQQFLGIYGSLIAIIMLITFSGQLLVRSLLDEKSNRIMEILLSSVTSTELMAGKLLGLGGLGLFQGVIWGILGLIAALKFGVSTALVTNLPLVLLYAILGYLFYAAVLIGLGSTATTEQEAQNLTGYVIMMATTPFMFMFVLLESPNGSLAKILSYIPFLTAPIMSARITAQMPPLWEIASTIFVLIIAISGVTWLAARIFTVGVLSYGKRLTFKEMIQTITDQQ